MYRCVGICFLPMWRHAGEMPVFRASERGRLKRLLHFHRRLEVGAVDAVDVDGPEA
jgi:hypothetical protein